MPLVQISVPAGSLDEQHKRHMVARVTDAVVEAEGTEAVRPFTWVHILEVADAGWGMAGRVLTLSQMQASLQKATG
jgi:4-oxalocrotonate tautomerase